MSEVAAQYAAGQSPAAALSAPAATSFRVCIMRPDYALTHTQSLSQIKGRKHNGC